MKRSKKYKRIYPDKRTARKGDTVLYVLHNNIKVVGFYVNSNRDSVTINYTTDSKNKRGAVIKRSSIYKAKVMKNQN